MAHYSVTVCLPPEAATDIDGALATALAPFGGTTDLEWDFGYLWDSWHVEGGSDGHGFWVRPGCEHDPRLIHDSPDWRDGAARLSLPGLCAGGPRGLLDLTESPELGRTLAIEAWQLWHRLAKDNPPALPLGAIMRRIEPNPRRGVDFEQVRAEYEAQPLIQAYRAAHPLGGRDPERFARQIQFLPGDLTYFDLGADGFADRVVFHHLGGWDLLTLDGWWIDADRAAAHHASCGSACPHQPDSYTSACGDADFAAGYSRYLDALPSDTLLVRIHGRC